MTTQAEQIATAIYYEGFKKAFSKNLFEGHITLDSQNAELITELGKRFTIKDWKNYAPLSTLANYSPITNGLSLAENKYVRVLNTTDPFYPNLNEKTVIADAELTNLIQSLTKEIEKLDINITNQLQILRFLAEKYLPLIGIKCGGDDGQPYAWYDILQSFAAMKVASLQTKRVRLAALDFSGIQDFVYNISSYRALRSLRGRSLFLEVVSQVLIREILSEAGCTDDCVITRSGGYYMLVLPDLDSTALEQIVNKWNAYLLNLQESRLFVAFAMSDETTLPSDLLDTSIYKTALASLNENLAKVKRQKFLKQLSKSEFEPDEGTSKSCSICRRHVQHNELHDITVKDTKNEAESEASGGKQLILVCDFCEFVIELATEAVKNASTNASNIVNIKYDEANGKARWVLNDVKLVLGDTNAPIKSHNLKVVISPKTAKDLETPDLFVVRVPFSEQDEYRVTKLAEKSLGWAGLGAMRADVDNLGSLIKNSDRNLPLLSLLSSSRLLSLFFADYVARLQNGDEAEFKQWRVGQQANSLRNILTVYGGGDDFFGIGSFSDTVEFSLDLALHWKKFVGDNPHATLSMGLTRHDPKFPIQATAQLAGDELDHKAKKKEGMFGDLFIEKDSISASFGRQPLMWSGIIKKASKNEFNDELEKLMKPLYQLLKSEPPKLSRAFLRHLLDADAATHPLCYREAGQREDSQDTKWKAKRQAQYKHDKLGQVDLLYLLASSPERKRLCDSKDPDWAIAYEYLKTLQAAPKPADLTFYLSWLDLVVRKRTDNNGEDK